MSDLKIQLQQEAEKMAGTGRGKLFESALERINELERHQSEVAARAVEDAIDYAEKKAKRSTDVGAFVWAYANQLRKGDGDE